MTRHARRGPLYGALVLLAVCPLILARARRWRTLLGWSALSLAAAAGYLTGFSLSHEHRFVSFSVAGLGAILRYWMTLLGSVQAMGNASAAPWLGAGLLGVLCWLGTRRRTRGEPIVFPLAWYAVAALGLIALGRGEIARSGFICSRRRDRLPTGDYELGFLVNNGSTFECRMTRQRLFLGQEGRVLLAAR